MDQPDLQVQRELLVKLVRLALLDLLELLVRQALLDQQVQLE